MPSVPAKCRNCGLVWGAPGGIFLSGGSISLKGNTYGPCPRCGGQADLLEGTFDVVGDFFSVIQAPTASREMLNELRLLLIESNTARDSPAAVIGKVEDLSPVFARALRGLITDPALFSALLVAIITLLTAIVEKGEVHIDIHAFETFNTFVTNSPHEDSAGVHAQESSESKRRDDPNSTKDRPTE
jgi:hypothetical protein